MAVQQFTPEEWKLIRDTLGKDPVKYGLPRRVYGSAILGSFNNETEMGKKPTGPDYGVFNFAELFATALGMPDSQRGDLIRRFEHKVSDHMPL